MSNKKKSILTSMLDKVSNLFLLKGTTQPTHDKMKPGKGFNQPVSDHAFDYLKELNDEEFEKLVTMIFKQRGYSVADNNEIDGVNIILTSDNETTLVQYTHWREYQVDLPILESFCEIVKNESAPKGIIITAGIFTQDALDTNSEKLLLLINGVDLSQMINVLTSSSQDELEELMSPSVDTEKDEMPELEPLCPICSQKMIKRTARKGKNAGNTFWGCSQYPNCRGVVSN